MQLPQNKKGKDESLSLSVPPQGLEGCLQPHRGSAAVATCYVGILLYTHVIVYVILSETKDLSGSKRKSAIPEIFRLALKMTKRRFKIFEYLFSIPMGAGWSFLYVVGIVFDTRVGLEMGYSFGWWLSLCVLGIVFDTCEGGGCALLGAGYRFQYPTLYCGLFGLFEDKKIRPERRIFYLQLFPIMV